MPRGHGGRGHSHGGGARGGLTGPVHHADDDQREARESMGRIPIPSFCPEDFPSWHFEMQSSLLAQKCWLVIEGDQDRWDELVENTSI